MRVSDDRYNRDRLRFDLAVRMIRHEARTCTIRQWTGLSDDRIRKLYRAYLLNQAATPLRRHRGKSPRQVDFFLRTPAVQFEGATLASLFCMLGLLSAAPALRADWPMTVERGELFCQAYETYLSLQRNSEVSFEHAWFLLHALLKRDELVVAACEFCGRLFLRESLVHRAAGCNRCARESQVPARRRRRSPAEALEAYRDWTVLAPSRR